MSQLPHISARQIRGARGLLNWTREDLSAASGLSMGTIRQLESGKISPRGQTMSAISRAFEDAGLEFLESDGVRYRPDDITTYYGVEGAGVFFDDVYATATKKGGDLVVVCPSEKPVVEALGSYQKHHLDRMMALKDRVKVKCILTEDTSHLPADYCEYRYISKHYVDSVPFYIYGNKYAIMDFTVEPTPKITVLYSPSMAKAFRGQFYSMWDKATPVKDSTSKPVATKKR